MMSNYLLYESRQPSQPSSICISNADDARLKVVARKPLLVSIPIIYSLVADAG